MRQVCAHEGGWRVPGNGGVGGKGSVCNAINAQMEGWEKRTRCAPTREVGEYLKTGGKFLHFGLQFYMTGFARAKGFPRVSGDSLVYQQVHKQCMSNLSPRLHSPASHTSATPTKPSIALLCLYSSALNLL